MMKASGVWYFMARRGAFVNSFRRVVRIGVHQALDVGDGCDRCVVASIVVRRAERGEENHRSSWLVERVSGGGGTSQSLRLSVLRLGQLASCHCGLGLSQWGEGGQSETKMRAWSDPVEGRHDASHERNAGGLCGLAKASSMADGRWVPVNGNRWLIPGVLRRVKPKSEARSK